MAPCHTGGGLRSCRRCRVRGGPHAQIVEVETVRGWLADGGEIAFLDVREEGQHGSGHPLLAVNLPYSRLEKEIARLVPRRSRRSVLLDDADGVAAKAARRLEGLGYNNIHVLAGGAAAWSAAGYRLFPSSNVPSKAFAEIIEYEFATPAISAAELDRLRRSGQRVTVLDSRPAEEYARFHVPGAITCPGAELVHRFSDLVDSPETLVVVSCAGRTRGIIGAQSLINAGIPNRVVSLSGGTQGWCLAGLELNHPNSPGQRQCRRRGATSCRGGRRPLRGRPYRPGDARHVDRRGRQADNIRPRRAHARGIRFRSASISCFGTTIGTPVIRMPCAPICIGRPSCPSR